MKNINGIICKLENMISNYENFFRGSDLQQVIYDVGKCGIKLTLDEHDSDKIPDYNKANENDDEYVKYLILHLRWLYFERKNSAKILQENVIAYNKIQLPDDSIPPAPPLEAFYPDGVPEELINDIPNPEYAHYLEKFIFLVFWEPERIKGGVLVKRPKYSDVCFSFENISLQYQYELSSYDFFKIREEIIMGFHIDIEKCELSNEKLNLIKNRLLEFTENVGFELTNCSDVDPFSNDYYENSNYNDNLIGGFDNDSDADQQNPDLW